jgi:signal peptidase I
MKRPFPMLIISLSVLAISSLSIAFWAKSRTVIVVGESMEPTHHDGTRLVACNAYWLVGTIGRNDVIVFADPTDPSGYLIKRVVALGGDLVPAQYSPPAMRRGYIDYHVPSGQLYVLGDNRDVSEDSRVFGPISEKDVIGKCIHFWGGSMALPLVAGFGSILMITALTAALRHKSAFGRARLP